MHLLLSHAFPQIKMHKGVSYLSESRIERAYQTQTKDNDLLKRIATQDIGREAKARRQSIRNSVTISKK